MRFSCIYGGPMTVSQLIMIEVRVSNKMTEDLSIEVVDCCFHSVACLNTSKVVCDMLPGVTYRNCMVNILQC